MTFPLPRFARNGSYVFVPPASFTRSGAGTFGASQILQLAPAAWYRKGLGQTIATGVSVWADQSGNGRNLTQGTGANQPTVQADQSLLFNGTTQLMSAVFALSQPVSIYLLYEQVVFSSGHRVFDGGTLLSVFASQNVTTPGVNVNAGSATGNNTGAAIGSFVVQAFVVNNAATFIQTNNGAQTTGTAGTNSPGGFTIAAQFGGGNPANIAVKEIIIFPTAHNTSTVNKVSRYLGGVGGLSF